MNKQRVLLEFMDYDVGLYWQFFVSCEELQLLKGEVRAYNDWINLLGAGKCPPSSYVDKEYQTNRFLGRNKQYCRSEIFKRPGSRDYYEDIAVYFKLITLHNDEDELLEGKVELEPKSTLIEILTDPMGSEEIGLGYMLLPMTDRLLNV